MQGEKKHSKKNQRIKEIGVLYVCVRITGPACGILLYSSTHSERASGSSQGIMSRFRACSLSWRFISPTSSLSLRTWGCRRGFLRVPNPWRHSSSCLSQEVTSASFPPQAGQCWIKPTAAVSTGLNELPRQCLFLKNSLSGGSSVTENCLCCSQASPFSWCQPRLFM